jgi:hypothetical protein
MEQHKEMRTFGKEEKNAKKKRKDKKQKEIPKHDDVAGRNSTHSES